MAETRGRSEGSFVPLWLLLTAAAMAAYVLEPTSDLNGDGRFSIADIMRLGWLLVALPGLFALIRLDYLIPGLTRFFDIDRMADESAFWVVVGLVAWALYAALLALIEHGMARPAIGRVRRWLEQMRPRREPKGKPHTNVDGNPHRQIGGE